MENHFKGKGNKEPVLFNGHIHNSIMIEFAPRGPLYSVVCVAPLRSLLQHDNIAAQFNTIPKYTSIFMLDFMPK